MKIDFNIKLTKKQKEAYNLIHSDECKTLVACWSRQSGKSVFAEIMLIEYLCKPRAFSAYISPSFSQGRKVYKEIIGLLDITGIIKKANASTLTIETTFKSQLQFFSMESPTAIRGYTVSGILVMDEASFFPDVLSDGSEPWSSVIMPITKARKPKTLVISTPKGKRGMFHDFYLKALSGTSGYKELTSTIYDDELITNEDIEDIKKQVSPLAFQEEFECKFLDSSLTFFSGFENCFTTFNYNFNSNQYVGIDLSSVGQDATILTKINDENQVIQYKIEGSLDSKYQQIANILNETKNLQVVYLENNGIGAPIINEIQKLVKENWKLKEWQTTNSSKEEIVSNMAIKIANKAIAFNEQDKGLYSELSTFIVKYTKLGRMQFEASGSNHDDRVMSLCIANKAKDDYKVKYNRTFATVLKF